MMEDTAQHGWVMYGPDGNWHWSATKDLHECIDDQRPATALEKAVFNRFGNSTENLEASTRVIDNIADPSTLTTAENAIRDATLDHAAKICREITSWGFPPTELQVADSIKAFCSKVILAQRSDSPERIKHNATD